MVRVPVSRETLTQKALSAVQQEPGCATVRGVAVTPVKLINSGSVDWHLQVVDPGRASVEDAYHAAGRVKDALAAKFELSDT